MRGSSDAIHFVETVYGGGQESESTWMKTVVAAAGPLFGPSSVIAISRIDLSGPTVRVSRLHGISREVSEETMVASIAGQPRADWMRLTSVPVALVSEHYGPDAPARPGMAMLGANDVLGVSTRLGDEALILAATLSAPMRLDPRVRRKWFRLSAHFAAAARLRSQPRQGRAAPEAVFTPDGRAEHLERDARRPDKLEALRAAVRDVEEARAHVRRSHPERALAMWRALVEGRWSLVDHFDTDGRRFLVARKNPPRAVKARALDAEERIVANLAVEGRSNKQIAYELGLAQATVSSVLRSSASKIGARSRVELVHLLATLEREAKDLSR